MQTFAESPEFSSYQEALKKEINEQRYRHSIRVMDTCEQLARCHQENIYKAMLAGLLHDCARDRNEETLRDLLAHNQVKVSQWEILQPVLLHAKAAGILAKELFGITDEAVLNAMVWHTTGKENMTILEKIVFLADCIEPGRSFPGVDEIRMMAYNNLDQAVLMALKNSISYIVSQEGIVHPDTLNAYNWLLLQRWG